MKTLSDKKLARVTTSKEPNGCLISFLHPFGANKQSHTLAVKAHGDDEDGIFVAFIEAIQGYPQLYALDSTWKAGIAFPNARIAVVEESAVLSRELFDTFANDAIILFSTPNGEYCRVASGDVSRGWLYVDLKTGQITYDDIGHEFSTIAYTKWMIELPNEDENLPAVVLKKFGF